MPAHLFAHLPSLSGLAALAAVVLAACGGSNKPSGPASSGSSGKAFTASNADKFPACMREHGVTNFPDPQVNGNSVQIQLTPSITGAPAFKSAQKACGYLLPAGAGKIDRLSPVAQQANTAGVLAFAACMRSRGFPNFPDPTSSGQLTHEMLADAGISLHQPAVLPAADACVSVTHGVITRAIVARFVAGQ